jgi:phosphoglycerate kinase
MQLGVRSMDALDVRGKRVLVREDLNVPLDESGRIGDDTRIRAALPTLRALLERGARPVVMSHLGRPQGKVVEAMRLGPVAARLAELLEVPVHKLDDCVGPQVEAAVRAARPGGVVLLENVRFHAQEERGDAAFAAALARLGEAFVNDAFGTSHRDHASVCGVARLLPSAAGLLLAAELEAFQRVLESPERPLVAILGGAKVSDKLPVVANLIGRVDALLVGGGMAYTFLAAQGAPVGASLVQAGEIEAVRQSIARAKEAGCELCLPSDHVVAERFAQDAPPRTVSEIPAGWLGLDIGPRTRASYAEVVRGARTLVWNGPMGVFEWPSFRAGTEAVGRAVAACAGYTVVGGGDSVAAIELLGLADEIDHISTGGGASLELLEGKLLPGIEALMAR